MEITRRGFCRMIASAAVLVVAGGCRFAARVLPRHFVRAVRVPVFPGRLRTLAEDEIKHPGKWSG